jgi:hypothetical protein
MMIAPSDIPAIVALRDTYKLTVGEAQAVLIMATSGIATHASIRDVYCDKPDTSPIEARQCIKRIRAKRTGLQILTCYGIGYQLADPSLIEVRSIIAKGRKKYQEAA